MPTNEHETSRSKSTVAAWRIIVVGALALGVVVAIAMRKRDRAPGAPANSSVVPPAGEAAQAAGASEKIGGASDTSVQTAAGAKSGTAVESKGLPKLLDLGSVTCMACKMMEPVLDELRKECRGKLDVEFIDVWKNQEAGEKFGVQMIPTQIFFGPDGKELWRHTGFISKDDILAKWKEFGIAF